MNAILLTMLLAAASVAAAQGSATKHASGGHDSPGSRPQPANGKSAQNSHAAAVGEPGESSKVTRTIEITMDDSMRFTPATIDIAKGETIRFAVRNAGKIKHEMVLGTMKELRAHAALMRKFPTMEHADPNQASVEPGASAELIWHFTKAGTFDFACLQVGHFDAGMKGKLVVSASAKPAARDHPAAHR